MAFLILEIVLGVFAFSILVFGLVGSAIDANREDARRYDEATKAAWEAERQLLERLDKIEKRNEKGGE